MATGVYPFPSLKEFDYFELLDALCKRPETRLPAGQYGEAAQTFVSQQLVRDVDQRSSADALLQHPFLAMASTREDFAEWLAALPA